MDFSKLSYNVKITNQPMTKYNFPIDTIEQQVAIEENRGFPQIQEILEQLRKQNGTY